MANAWLEELFAGVLTHVQSYKIGIGLISGVRLLRAVFGRVL